MWIFAGVGSIIAMIWSLKNLFFIEKIIDGEMFNALYDLQKDKRKFVFQERISILEKYPLLYSGYGIIHQIPYFISLDGGFKKETIAKITALRIHGHKLEKFLKEELLEIQKNKYGVPVSVMDTWYNRSLGYIKNMEFDNVHGNKFDDFELDVKNIANGTLDKTGIIIYGPPGTGKTTEIRRLAIKYHLPIQIFTFSPNMDNTDILVKFASLRSKSICLLEDFDNIFDKRKCTLGDNGGSGNNSIKFTFDSVLNGLDGIFNTYNGVIFVLTCNNIDKIDEAIKDRPSRVKHKIFLDYPAKDIREKYIGGWEPDIPVKTNLDQLIRLSIFKKNGLDLNTSLDNLGLLPKNEKIIEIKHIKINKEKKTKKKLIGQLLRINYKKANRFRKALSL